jgi:hypothetical protein
MLSENFWFPRWNNLSVVGGRATGPIVLTASRLPEGWLKLAWTNSATDLYQTPSLTPPVVWLPATNLPDYANGQWSVSVPGGTNKSMFYRLQQ